MRDPLVWTDDGVRRLHSAPPVVPVPAWLPIAPVWPRTCMVAPPPHWAPKEKRRLPLEPPIPEAELLSPLSHSRSVWSFDGIPRPNSSTTLRFAPSSRSSPTGSPSPSPSPCPRSARSAGRASPSPSGSPRRPWSPAGNGSLLNASFDRGDRVSGLLTPLPRCTSPERDDLKAQLRLQLWELETALKALREHSLRYVNSR